MAATFSRFGSPTYEKIATRTLTSAGSITFSNIPQNYTDLIVVMTGTRDSVSNTYITVGNGSLDTGANYSLTYMRGTGSSALSSRSINISNGCFIDYDGNNPSASQYNVVEILDYSSNIKFKTMLSKTINSSTEVGLGANIWRSTNPINIIRIAGIPGNLNSGYTATIYGIESAKAPKALGGDYIASDGYYWYHAFRNSGTFRPLQALSCDVVVVGGGGAGGSNGKGSRGAGGGGAGGYRSATSLSLTANTDMAVTVGAGGAASLSEGTTLSSNGNSSIFSTITSAGGGYGGAWNGSAYVTGNSGGSGGGATGQGGISGASGNTPSTSPSQGNSGGAGNDSNYTAGGGGGAGGTGGNGGSTTGGTGGIGSNAHSAWLLATYLGSSGYAAAGGGGGARNATGGSGGTGGGGSGAGDPVTIAGSGLPGTGSGGGGAGTRDSNTPHTFVRGGNGGSGFVIVRYSV